MEQGQNKKILKKDQKKVKDIISLLKGETVRKATDILFAAMDEIKRTSTV